jgi:predicted membrane protein
LELDLSRAELADGVNELEIRAVCGGVVLYIPADWHIEIQKHQVLVGVQDNRPKSGFVTNNDKILIIHTDIVLGGCEIKCK